MKINIIDNGGALAVQCPYTKAFTSFAHSRGGKWSDGKKCWMFDPRDEFAVRSTLTDIYGTDDYEVCEKVDVRLDLGQMKTYGKQRLFVCGREVAVRRYHDYRVDLGYGVVVIAGGFPRTSPERREVVLGTDDGTILEVRGVPVGILPKSRAQLGDALAVLGRMDIEKLRMEREYCLKRIEEIDRLIEWAENTPDEEERLYAELSDDPDEPPESSGGEAVAG